jgi:DNA-binding response OmpR family regulator
MGGQPVVLVVEDDEYIYDLLSEYLASCGYSVFGASRDDKVIELVDSLHPQAVIVDYERPDGFGLTRELRAHDPDHHLPILLVTSRVETRLEREARVAGCDGVVRKPFHLDALAEELHRIMA